MSADTYTSLSEIIEKVQRDDLHNEQVEWEAAAEWAGECLDRINAPRAYVDLSKCIAIEDFKGLLPCDFHQVVSVKNNGTGLPMTVTTDNFFAEYYAETCPDVPDRSMNKAVDTGTFQGTDQFKSPTVVTSSSGKGGSSAYEQYYIKGNFIFTTFEQGEVLMAYRAFPVDEQGLPMIPASEAVKKAVKAYITERVFWKKLINGEIGQYLYEKVQTDYFHAAGQADTTLRTPTIDEMEAWKNSMQRTIPKPDQHSTGHAAQGIPEQRYTHNSYQGPGHHFRGDLTIR